jgi:hypothetical protein
MQIDCPLPAALTTIPGTACPFKLDQIVRMGLQRRQAIPPGPFTTLVALQTLANWTTFQAAVDSTKVVVTPLFAGLVIPQSEGLFTGGNDNSTFNGIPDYNGEGMVTITGTFKNIAPATKRAMDLLAQESLAGVGGTTNLTAYLFNKDGYSFQQNPSGTIYAGVPIYNFRVSSLGSEGFNAPNTHGFSFSVPSTWADYLTSVKPAFDPLTQL